LQPDCKEFPEAVFVMLFFQVGELFEGYAEGKSRDSIKHDFRSPCYTTRWSDIPEAT
jgi:Cd2+/Zn2+-exporting ATPase